jgi:hypothetical protein
LRQEFKAQLVVAEGALELSAEAAESFWQMFVDGGELDPELVQLPQG